MCTKHNHKYANWKRILHSAFWSIGVPFVIASLHLETSMSLLIIALAVILGALLDISLFEAR